MALDRARLLSASEAVLSAAALGQPWEDALDGLAHAAGSHSACVWSSRKGRHAYLGNRTFTVEGIAKINRPGDPPYTDEILFSSNSDDGFVPMLSHRTRPRIERLPFYQDVLTKIDFAEYAGCSLDPADGWLLKVAFWRSFEEGAFDADEVGSMNSIMFNVRHAILFARQKQELLSRQTAAPFVTRGEATFAIDSDGLVKPISDVADRIMGTMPLEIVRGRFAACSDGETRRVDRVVGDAVTPIGRPGSVVLTSPAGDRFQFIALPLHGQASDVFSGTRAIATVIRLGGADPCPLSERTRCILQSAFGLTSREAEVAALAAAGSAPAAIAKKLSIGEGTIRNHVKVVFAKSGVRSQVELAALVARYH